ncbi:hypothetical protein EBH_0005710 [Eimeria brunetti]|uniref:Uncharacterized protein n=1 Tax=Eimeria brunetti TaxID=51314 RepID=U6LWM4_9EIME|nr:hypothetical protein EBH_0005710 [Eimeria brunetti]
MLFHRKELMASACASADHPDKTVAPDAEAEDESPDSLDLCLCLEHVPKDLQLVVSYYCSSMYGFVS